METTKFEIRGPAFATCNCAWGCPCQFNALPTTGRCEALWAMRIDKGNFNGVRLDGLVWGTLFSWPGAVHEGNGKVQLFLEEQASADQRQALETIGAGQVSAEGTFFQIFAAMAPHLQPSVTAAIDFDCDIEAGKAHLKVRDLVEAEGTPIRNKITGIESRSRVVLPGGFEYREAEYISGDTLTLDKAAIKLDLKESHAHVYYAAWDNDGVIAV
ncbi:DUF1326 domain-containing protein [Sinomicrobium weinanense]|uniref:DUF1326 domain-containing protein n=1 Tax=Sinomicrobium weinanense TaxID=2842200 RepID=A0A926JV60_9FLAO|nr:DUF1326 domain-containing protein [Sinomicrobium weinanense]MBC9798165.1 DUF1326 domain-containing protein [Sinomicrobium weinanense]MBU3122129.1 DUF1326 domain-containing protein [Sinomicrobium weinanense]